MIETLTTVPSVNLQAPELTKDNLITVVTKIHPYRIGGIRKDHEQINGKHIFHNYGHGSTGISLAYGSVKMTAKSLPVFADTERPKQCAIIGSGRIGLLTAIQLLKMGHIVTIYSDKFPNYSEKQINKKLGSQINDGLFLPFGYDLKDRLAHQIYIKLSFQAYKAWLKSGRYQSFKSVPVYQRNTTIQQLKDKIPPFLYNNYKKQYINFGSGNLQQYTKYKTFKIDCELWLQQLRIQAALRGATFIEKKFNTLNDILLLKQNNIFNCSGYSSKYLFNDQNITGLMDHIVIFKNNRNLEYSLSANLNSNIKMRLTCFGDKVVLRGETSLQNSNEQYVKTLIKETQSFFAIRSLQAKL